MLPVHQRGMLFILVGSAAALAHFLTVVFIVERSGLAPLLANVLGWLCAFWVSFGGHHYLTFSGHGTPVLRSVPRFFLISAVGFTINESSYAVLLSVTDQPYYLLLGIVLVFVAVLTYVLSQDWAFRRIDP